MNKFSKSRLYRLPLLFSILTIASPLFFSNSRTPAVARSLIAEMSTGKDLYRADGVRIGYDPYSPEMREKYGSPGETDSEGFDPYSDSVGAGIYGGRVKRNDAGEIIYGEQYQNHNDRPGPVYAGGGYTPMINALRNGEAGVKTLLEKYPDLANEVTTGGATPLHMCGMSKQNQMATAYLISKGADINAFDTYGFQPIHRMASNNLAIGAEALLAAGADPRSPTEGRAETPYKVARDARAYAVMAVIEKYLK